MQLILSQIFIKFYIKFFNPKSKGKGIFLEIRKAIQKKSRKILKNTRDCLSIFSKIWL